MKGTESFLNARTIVPVLGALLGAGKGRLGAALGAFAGCLVVELLDRNDPDTHSESGRSKNYASHEPEVEREPDKYCKECGRPNRADNFYCIYCGRPFKDQ
ncbi:MAG TPA: hypothetical protein PLB36_05680 [Bacillota bacterium]|nr:hypothetical protein [Bacillota bacterium]HOL12353.1 hypothetical protein [Bacillota bacterium]HPP61255.1 hypothetical protein [Bacillota bacterium]HPZ78700.1 hypothetical protein [Bacillota bacterium]HQD74761.1 hypothetical protein [Bacillota bacterium]